MSTRVIERDINGDLSVLIAGERLMLSGMVGQLERVVKLITTQAASDKAAREAGPDAVAPDWMLRVIEHDYAALDVILHPDPAATKRSIDELKRVVPVNHARQIVRAWLKMIYDPGAESPPAQGGGAGRP